MASLGQTLKTNRAAQIGELLTVAAVALAAITLVLPLVGDNPIARQSVVWATNILMLGMVWLGLRLRGQTCSHFGLTFRFSGWRNAVHVVLKSFAVFGAATGAFIIGSIIMANIVGRPEPADMSRYNYLRGNLLLLIVALAAVYVVSSFGEEVIYRAFLITRVSELGFAKWGRTLGVAVSTVLFALIHYEWGLMGMVQTGFMGLALALSYLLVKRNLWVLILAHGYMDTLLLVQMYLATS